MLSTIEDIRRIARNAGGQDVSATAMLERFGFTGDRLTARLGDLSGGERRRFQLLKILLSEPNVLLLDEPTNDLDIETLTVLEDFLDGWPGTLIVVSHDRYFLERVTDTVWALLGDGTIGLLPGGVDQYLEMRRRGFDTAAVASPEVEEVSPTAETTGARPRPRSADPRSALPGRRWPGSTSSSSGSRSRRPRSTARSRRRPVTTPRWPRSPSSCGCWPRNGRRWRPSGSRPLPSWSSAISDAVAAGAGPTVGP